MSTGLETTQIIEPWLYETLSKDPALTGIVGDRVHANIAPQSDFPYLTFGLESTRDVQNHQGAVVLVDAIYLVKLVDNAESYDRITPGAARLSTLLHRPAGVTTPAGHLTVVRDRIVQYPQIADGIQYRHLGARFRFEANSL